MKLLSIASFVLTTSSVVVLAAPPSSASEFPQAVTVTLSGRTSQFVLAPDERHVLWAATEGSGTALFSAALGSGHVSRVRALPEASESAKSLALSRHGERSDRLLFGARCCGETSAWCIWALGLSGSADVRFGEEECSTDGRPVASPSGAFVAVGTDFNCIGGGHDCGATSVSVFAVRRGKVEFVAHLPHAAAVPSSSDPLGNPDIAVSTIQREPALTLVGWCEQDVLILQRPDLSRLVYGRSKTGVWAERPGEPFCPVVTASSLQAPPLPTGESAVLVGTRVVVTVTPLPPDPTSPSKRVRLITALRAAAPPQAH